MAGDLSCRSDAKGWLGSTWEAAQVLPSPLRSIFPVNWQRSLESAGLFLSDTSEGSAKAQQQSTETPDLWPSCNSETGWALLGAGAFGNVRGDEESSGGG